MRASLVLALLLARPAAAAPFLKALTYNVAGIPLVHARWDERRAAIGAKLREGRYDLVAVQETWRDKDALELAEASGLPYYTRYRRSISFGTGLAIFSRYPIVEKRQRSFTCRPSALRWMQGESVANKGVLMARVATPKGELDVYTAHLIAEYAGAKYRTLRWTQIFELAEMISEESAGRPFLLMGDLNTSLGDRGYALLMDLLGLEDACVVGGKEACGVTNAEDGARIDHILFPRGPGRAARARTAFAGGIPGAGVAYSDHLALEAELDASLMRRRLAPDPKRREAALSALETRIAAMISGMMARERSRAWLPVYGFLILTRYEHQHEQLASIAARAESARIRAVEAAR